MGDAIRARVHFDRSDLRIAETSNGSRVTMRGLVEAGGEHVPALPMSIHAFYVPSGFEVDEVRATS